MIKLKRKIKFIIITISVLYFFINFAKATDLGGIKKNKVIIVGVKDDGVIGPATLNAVRSKAVQDVIEGYSDHRQKFLESLPTFGDFGKGWTRRVVEVEDQSKRMA